MKSVGRHVCHDRALITYRVVLYIAAFPARLFFSPEIFIVFDNVSVAENFPLYFSCFSSKKLKQIIYVYEVFGIANCHIYCPRKFCTNF